ncbi:MAG: hypothetical protein WBP23_00510 [Candidatus Saccharimonadales bacterium]
MRHEPRVAAIEQWAKSKGLSSLNTEAASAAEPVHSAGASEQRAGEWRLDSSVAMILPQEGRAPLQDNCD